MIELLRLIYRLSRPAIPALTSLVRGALEGESKAELLSRAERFAYVASFEAMLAKARRG